MHPFQDRATAAMEAILRQAAQNLIDAGVPLEVAKARVCQRFEILNWQSGPITVEALCVPPTDNQNGHNVASNTSGKVEKNRELVSPPAVSPPATSITNYFYGPNARVNHNSVDKSSNVVGDHAVFHERVADLKRSIEAADLPDNDRAEALEVVDNIDEHVSSGDPKRSVLRALLASLPQIASVAKLGTEIVDLCK
ncbi:MAG: hypothetical protein KGJ32_13805 [Xanthomonadaceae bacterium]|nr:hypothetical protein [Xanthomonadaceae bacterium]